MKKINDFPVKPSWIVDTRNGYQCYWMFDNKSKKFIGNNRTLWNGLQKKLVNYFGADARAIKPNQILRVPYTWWNKSWEKKVPYFTSIVSGSLGNPIDINSLQKALDGHSTIVKVDPIKCSDMWYKKGANDLAIAREEIRHDDIVRDRIGQDDQIKLLKTVIEFLYQISTPLYYSKNHFLSNTAKELASKISDKFCIG